jgi:ferredoxin
MTMTPRYRQFSSLLYLADESAIQESYTDHSVTLTKPMGLILEEAQDEEGVKIVSMGGAAAKASQQGNVDLCVGDTLVKVGTKPCADWTFDEIMEAIIEESDPVTLTLRRPNDAIPVTFLENGVCIAAKPGMSIGALGFMAKAKITYSCRNGGCGTCEHIMVICGADGKTLERRLVRPCVGKVPKGLQNITIIPPERYEPL